MTLLPKRTAVVQVAEQLKREIFAGKWRGVLPSERSLCRELHVSRSTLRAALTLLERWGLTKPEHGVGHRITSQQKKNAAAATRSIGVLIPQPLTALRPHIALWIDELQSLLHAAGCELHLHCAPSLYRQNPARVMGHFLQRHPSDCWIVVRGTKVMQEWLAQKRVPCVVAGSLFPGVVLPSVDVDYRAITRHAVGELLRNGHRRIALLIPELALAGEVESEKGFHEAVQASRHIGIDAAVYSYKEMLAPMLGVLRRILDKKSPPTGLVVANSNYYLATVTELARRGLRVPEDVSLISRDDDPFLDFIVPSPARYRNDPKVFASKAATFALRILEHGNSEADHVTLLLRYDPGQSVANV